MDTVNPYQFRYFFFKDIFLLEIKAKLCKMDTEFQSYFENIQYWNAYVLVCEVKIKI